MPGQGILGTWEWKILLEQRDRTAAIVVWGFFVCARSNVSRFSTFISFSRPSTIKFGSRQFNIAILLT